MSIYMTMILIVTTGILVFSLVYTLRITKQQKVVKSNLDTKIDKRVEEHPYTRNPVFLTYGIFFVLLLLIITFIALSTNY
ncbi:hypothetical protein LS684_07215 [Cytobacillus spongiae]|jgi:hypothetical protein|uniref:hypothetical protein n=1 Tax=Cytobacillus spongiae TaxID=2901381 RepID=UPI001F2C091E|nr:hypothetical protein [Cytobacillus spongiae]UII57224.1 hypothetical protein LS684_07215 [Cytobacillus spongiae]